MKLHIEFIGVPGSGKTTIYNEVIKKIETSNNPYMSLKKAIWISICRGSESPLRFFLKNIPYPIGKLKAGGILHFLRDIDISKQEFTNNHPDLVHFVENIRDQNPDKVSEWMYNLFGRFQFVKKNLTHEEVLIIDEGFAQRAISLFAYQNSYEPELLQKYSSLIPVPSILFVIEVDDEKREGYMRVAKRDFPTRMKDMGTTDRLLFYKRSKKIIDKFTNNLKHRGAKIVRINNNQELDKSVNEVMNKIML